MNNKAEYLNKIIDIVVSCCETQVDTLGKMSLSRADIIGKSREENVVMSRCILAMIIVGEGYSITTISQLLNRSPHAIRNMLAKGHEYHISSRAYRIASAEAVLRV